MRGYPWADLHDEASETEGATADEHPWLSAARRGAAKRGAKGGGRGAAAAQQTYPWSRRPPPPPPPAGYGGKLSYQHQPLWYCPSCGTPHDNPRRSSCRWCGRPRPQELPRQELAKRDDQKHREEKRQHGQRRRDKLPKMPNNLLTLAGLAQPPGPARPAMASQENPVTPKGPIFTFGEAPQEEAPELDGFETGAEMDMNVEPDKEEEQEPQELIKLKATKASLEQMGLKEAAAAVEAEIRKRQESAAAEGGASQSRTKRQLDQAHRHLKQCQDIMLSREAELEAAEKHAADLRAGTQEAREAVAHAELAHTSALEAYGAAKHPRGPETAPYPDPRVQWAQALQNALLAPGYSFEETLAGYEAIQLKAQQEGSIPMPYVQYAWACMNQSIMGAMAKALPLEATPVHILGQQGTAGHVQMPSAFQQAPLIPQELMPPLGGAPTATPVLQGAAAAPAVPPAAAAQRQRPGAEEGTRARDGSHSPRRTSRSAHRSRSGGERGRREDA